MFLVINMEYTVLEYKEEYKGLFNQYPRLKDYLINMKANDNYMKSLKNSYYIDVSFLNDIIFHQLVNRKEYTRKDSLHILNNQLTGEKMTLEIKNNKIYINSFNKKNIFFYIIYQNLKSYVIMDGKL